MQETDRGRWIRLLFLATFVHAGTLAAAGSDAPLIEAAKRGDTEAERTLLKQQIDPNSVSPDGTTALHWAAYREDLASVELLIGAGANVRAANRYGVTPLSLACEKGNASIIERLLNAGAEANTALAGGETALMTAARTGNPDVIKVLLAHGADVNARESTRQQTALMWAAAQGNAAAIRELIVGGADVHARSSGPKPAGKSAIGANDNFYKLYYYRNASSGRVDALTPLLFAVRRGQLEAVRALLDGGANVNDALPDGTSGLVLTAINAHWEVGALLLERGANPNADGQGWSALHQVARTRGLSSHRIPHPVPTGRLTSLEFAKQLIAHGANLNARMTVEFKDGERYRYTCIGVTPLWLAAKNNDIELMRLLAESGAAPSLTNATHTTVLMAAAGVQILYVGEEAGSDEDPVDAVKLALDLGGDVNAVDDNGDTALHGAAFRGANATVQLLVDKGAKLDARNKKGWTPLQTAVADYVGDFVTEQPATAELLRRLMEARGLPTNSYSADEIRAMVATGKALQLK